MNVNLNWKPTLILAVTLAGQARAQFIRQSIERGVTPISMNSQTSGIDLIQKFIGTGSFLRVGPQLLELSKIRQFYSLRQNRMIWTEGSKPSLLVATFREYCNSLGRHGLRPTEYWTQMLEGAFQNLIKNPSETSTITAELLVTDAYLRLAQNLFSGNVDPDQIDNDIKFKRKSLGNGELLQLTAGVLGDSEKLKEALDSFAPQIPLYKDLMMALQSLRDRKINHQSYAQLPFPGAALGPASKHQIIPKLRAALQDRGFVISNTNSDIYDSELQKIVTEYQAENAMEVDATLIPNSDVWRSLSYSLDQRIRQIEINMEKLRWLPSSLEDRHIFVNTAFAELNVIENGLSVLGMKTVNGRPMWRTPSMRDLLVGVILNPTWTAPDSIVTQIKLPELKRDPQYLERAHIRLKNRVSGEEIPTADIDWITQGLAISRQAFFVQDPGPDNALGVVKFVLGVNKDDIYMHDTNERDLFSKGSRQRSSGCIRLEKPLELATYILKDTSYTPEKLNEVLVNGSPDQVFETNLRVNLPKPNQIPVYMMYLTAQRGENGRIRFAADYYGQDSRVANASFQNTQKREGDYK